MGTRETLAEPVSCIMRFTQLGNIGLPREPISSTSIETIKKRFILFYVHVCILLSVFAHVYTSDLGGQKVLNPTQLKLHVF